MSKVHASLFSGFGGADLAAHWMGWENAFWCEIDGFCQQVLRYWFPKSKGYENIKETDFTPWRGKVDVLTGGFPCQPFSVAGQRKGAADDRYLWPEMLRAIREIRPAWVIGENVTGILSMVQPGCEITVESQASLFEEADKETLREEEYVVETVCRDLEQEGYSVQPVVIPACAFGAPHRRDRVWFIARRIDDNGNNRREHLSRPRGLSVSEPVEMEDKQCGIRLSNNSIKERGKEMGYYLDAQVNLLRGGRGRGRSYQPEQIRQSQTKFEDYFPLAKLSQQKERVRSKETHGKEQVACPNICEQSEDISRKFQYKGGGNECKSGSRKKTPADTDGHDAGRSGYGETGCPAGGGQKPERERERVRGNVKRTGKKRNAPYSHSVHGDLSGFRSGWLSQLETTEVRIDSNAGIQRCEKQCAISESEESRFSDWLSNAARRDWREFPTQSPVCRGNDGLPFDVVCLTLSLGEWRGRSIKGYGNAIVPQVIYEIFKAIETIQE